MLTAAQHNRAGPKSLPLCRSVAKFIHRPRLVHLHIIMKICVDNNKADKINIGSSVLWIYSRNIVVVDDDDDDDACIPIPSFYM